MAVVVLDAKGSPHMYVEKQLGSGDGWRPGWGKYSCHPTER